LRDPDHPAESGRCSATCRAIGRALRLCRVEHEVWFHLLDQPTERRQTALELVVTGGSRRAGGTIAQVVRHALRIVGLERAGNALGQ
jgi:hypothetical protein